MQFLVRQHNQVSDHFNPVYVAAGPPDDAARNQRRGARQACSRSTLRAAAIVCAARPPVHELRLVEVIAALHDDVMDGAPLVFGLDGFQADEGAPRWLAANKGFAAGAPARKWMQIALAQVFCWCNRIGCRSAP